MQSIWLFRLGHFSHERYLRMSQFYPNINHDNKVVCDIFHVTRHEKLPYNSSSSKATQSFELLHFDIWGRLNINSIHDHKYLLTILDEFRRYVWIILLKSKSEISNHV